MYVLQTMITISCIIPTLEERPTMLEEAVASAMNQTVAFKEIIVESKPKRENRDNQAIKINAGIKRCTGDYYLFMGDDDKLKENFVEKMIQTIEKTDADIVSSFFDTFGNEEGTHGPEGYPLCSTVVRRSLWDKVGGFPLNAGPAVDALFYFKCFDAGAKWVKIEDSLYCSRVHDGQFSLEADWELSRKRKKELFDTRYDHV